MFVRVALVLLLIVWTLGTPGLGIETRTGGDVMGWVYTVAYLADILALVLTWRGRRFAPVATAAVGAGAAVIATLDVTGILLGTPPAAMIALDVASICIGLALLLKARSVRPLLIAALSVVLACQTGASTTPSPSPSPSPSPTVAPFASPTSSSTSSTAINDGRAPGADVTVTSDANGAYSAVVPAWTLEALADSSSSQLSLFVTPPAGMRVSAVTRSSTLPIGPLAPNVPDWYFMLARELNGPIDITLAAQ
jgi:hypothetical protein